MIDVVKEHMTEIIEACRQMQVKSLYLFGSGARGDNFGDNSDLDFIYSFKVDQVGMLLPPFYDYFDLSTRLEEITGKKVDLVAQERITNKFFLERINKEKIKLYES